MKVFAHQSVYSPKTWEVSYQFLNQQIPVFLPIWYQAELMEILKLPVSHNFDPARSYLCLRSANRAVQKYNVTHLKVTQDQESK